MVENIRALMKKAERIERKYNARTKGKEDDTPLIYPFMGDFDRDRMNERLQEALGDFPSKQKVKDPHRMIDLLKAGADPNSEEIRALLNPEKKDARPWNWKLKLIVSETTLEKAQALHELFSQD